MSEIRVINNDQYTGAHPTVFKKLDKTDVGITPFQTNKKWTFYSGSTEYVGLFGIYSDVNLLPALETELVYNDLKNIDGSLQTVTYFSINHLFYKNSDKPYNSFGPSNLNYTTKKLYTSASILSIPINKIGEGIKPASFTFTGSSLNLASDRYGNLYDNSFVTTSIVANHTFYEGFNEYFDTTRIKYSYENVTYVNGVPTTSGLQLPIGLSAYFSGSGYIQTELPGNYNRDENYAISFYIQGQNTGISNQLVLSKSNPTSSQYPFKVELSGSNQLVFSIAGSTTFKSQISSSTVVTGSWHHVVCQKSGSNMSMYINGVLESNVSNNLLINTYSVFTASARIDNTDPLHIGGYNTTTNNLYGYVDEIRVFNKGLSTTQVGYLADRTEGGSLLQTNRVGNVFDKHGFVIISSPDYRYNAILNSPYTASYRSTLTTYELGIVTKIDAGDFNLSLNPTLTTDNDVTYTAFATSSTFHPYITTIGLYDDAGQLLAIGKLAQPIAKRNDVDMNFYIRLDLDKNIL